MRVLLFDGQGATQAASSSNAPSTSLRPLAALFVRQAQDTLRARLAALTPDTERALSIGATRSLLMRLRNGQITLPTTDRTLLRQPIVSLPSVYISQTVRLLELLETGVEWDDSVIDIVGYSSGLLPALLVASSLPAPSKLSSSLPPSAQLTLLRNALALFEVSLLLGVETQVSKLSMLKVGGIALDDPFAEREWSAAVFNETREALEEKIEAWNVDAEDALHRIHLTAQTTATCHTISGLPSTLQHFILREFPEASHSTSSGGPRAFSRVSSIDSLRASARNTARRGKSPLLSPRMDGVAFAAPKPLHSQVASALRASTSTPLPSSPSPSLSQSPVVKYLEIHTLFHANVHPLVLTRDRILSTLSPSNECVNLPTPMEPSGNSTYLTIEPNLSIKKPEGTSAVLDSLRLSSSYILYDTRSGLPVPAGFSGKTLIGHILDLILLDRVEFSGVLRSLEDRIEADRNVELVNFGPGTSLVRVTMRTLKDRNPFAVCSWIDGSIPLRPVNPDSSNIAEGKKRTPTPSDNESIAIVGMAVNFPGARNSSELWRLLEDGMNTVEEIPKSRFSVSSYLDTNPDAKPQRKMKTRFGNFLADGIYDGFDNSFFHISPKEARALDPQMRLLMRIGFQAAEAAGLVIDAFTGDEDRSVKKEGVLHGEDVGCFVGVATNDYALNLKNDVGVHYATGTLPAFLAGRLAYALDLSGPSVVTNTACSSSVVAIHQACRAILAGDCKAALAGGVNVITSPDMYLGLDRGHFLSPSGNCKPWDASADGYCRGEGCGMFVFKRLSDALASSDNILGVIRATEVNQSAAAISITRPHAPTQQALIRTLLNKAGIQAEDVSLVEAHGTGTQAGDPEELKSLRAVLSPNGGSGRNVDNMLTVTSIKANIGHTEAASGAASLAKVLLMLQHGKIPAQVSLTNLNPKIEPLESDFTRINMSGKPIGWNPNADGRRIALVNNFGAAGSNAAMLVEQPPSRLTIADKAVSDQVLVALSADSEVALLRLRDSYLSSVSDANLVDFGYTATARRKLRPWRMAVTADSAGELVTKLSVARPALVPALKDDSKKTVFVFSGQGGQHLGMGRQLYCVSQKFRAVIDECHEMLVSWGYPGILAIINSDGTVSGLQESDELVAYQCAMFSLECALYGLWESWGVKPDAIVGHSLGEYAALVTAGVLTLDAGLRLVAHRVRLMAEYCARNVTGMLVVRLPKEAVEEAIASTHGCDGLSIACYNGSKDVVVGGYITQLKALKTTLEISGAKCVNVNVPFAYHTSAMAPILDDFAEFARKITFNAPCIPIVSNVTGKVVEPGTDFFNGDYLVRHCREPVRFLDGINNLASFTGAIGSFIELGPHPTTLPMISHLSNENETLALPSLHKKFSARSALLSSLSRLFVSQQTVYWGNVYRELFPATQCIEIPGYPLEETSFWVPYAEELSSNQVQSIRDLKTRFPFLDAWVNKPSSRDGNVSEFETPIEQVAEYISGHSVASVPLCPASVYSELALSAATCTLQYTQDDFNDALTLSEVQFTHPLLYDAANPVVIRTSINLHPRGGKHAGTFTISSLLNGVEQHVHCTGFFQRREKGSVSTKLQLHAGHIQRVKTSLLNPVTDTYHETLRTRTIYDLIFPRVVKYSKLYQVISTMTIDEKNGEAIATIRIPKEQADRSFVAQPVFVDALLHAAGFLINSRAPSSDAYICSQVDSTKLLSDLDSSATYEIYCTTSPASDGLILADAWAVQVGNSSKVVAHIKRMRFSRVRLSSLQKSLTRTVESFQINVPSPPAQFLKPSDSCSRPVTPAMLGSPFRVVQRAATPSTMSSVTAVNPFANDPSFDILKLVAEVSGVPLANIRPTSNMVDLGIDSLLWIEFIGQLKLIAPGHSFEVHDLMLCETVGELISKVSKVGHQSTIALKKMASFSSFSTPRSLRPVHEIPRMHTPIYDKSSSLTTVKDIIGKVLEIPASSLRGNASLDALGLDSLGSIEALHELQEQFKVDLPHDLFRECPTIDAVEAYVSHLLELGPATQAKDIQPSTASATVCESYLLPLQKIQTNAKPLFLVHDGSGLSNCYSLIGELGRPLWGISNPKLLTGEAFSGGIPEMAMNYATQIRAVASDKGCILGGWSFGGVVAFHAACQLMLAGVKVAGVVLIDSPSPFTKHSLPDAVINKVIGLRSENVVANDHQAKTIELARIQMAHATNALVAYDPLRSPDIANSNDLPNVVMIRCKDALPVDGLQHIPSERISFLCERDDPRAFVNDWEKLTGKSIPVLDIPGNHFEPFKPRNVSVLTQQLKKAVAHLEAL